MPKIVVLGAGVCGLATAMLLARDGHEVTVLERDADPVPETVEDAWEGWKRAGVIQFRQPHFLHALSRHVLEHGLPDLAVALEAAGALRFDYTRSMSPGIPDGERRPEDSRYVTLTARRTTLEWVFANAAAGEPRLEIRRGTGADRPLARKVGRVPHIEGVVTDAGDEVRADLVVDATGRRSQLPRWLESAGARPAQEVSEDCGFIYYSRWFRATNGRLPELRTGTLSPIGSISVLTVPADSGTWSVTVYTSSGDQPLKRLRNTEAWTRVVAACPMHAHWLEGEAISEILPMGGVVDRYRRFWKGDDPVATGVVVVSDALACTNPSLGRGLALGFSNASRLRDVVREHLADPAALAAAWDRVAEEEVAPWYRATVAVDRARLAEIDAVRKGLEPPAPGEPAAAALATIATAAPYDCEVLRGGLEISGCLTLPLDVWRQPGFAERALAAARGREAPRAPGPDRAELLKLLV